MSPGFNSEFPRPHTNMMELHQLLISPNQTIQQIMTKPNKRDVLGGNISLGQIPDHKESGEATGCSVTARAVNWDTVIYRIMNLYKE